jgi:aminoglycoside phosphotransferase family enzyme
MSCAPICVSGPPGGSQVGAAAGEGCRRLFDASRDEEVEACVLRLSEEPVTTKSPDQPIDVVRRIFERQADVEIVETPLSLIILTERDAYKVKKSVDLGEARFRSAAQRRHACVEETWRNQRLAPGVYLGIVPITRNSDGAFRLGGKGVEVEWLVRMRRLHAGCNMLALIRAGKLAANQVTELAQTLANFYQGGPPETDQLDELCRRLNRRINDAARELVEILPAKAEKTVRRLREVQHDFLNNERMVLNLRVCDGRVVDGHGELHPEHVFLERRPLVIDCIEYSPMLRKLDALDDLSKLAMECEHLGREDVAGEVMATYRRVANDDGFPHLEAFYKSLHAGTRAAIVAQRCGEQKSGMSRQCMYEAMAYLDQALCYANVIA